MIKWLGHATLTTASIVVRGTSNGTATLVCNGVSYAETVDTTVKDGLVRFDVSGLSASTSYPYTLTIPSGESVTSTLKTQSDGLAKVGWASCSAVGGDGAMWQAGKYGLDAMVSIGDEGYYEGTVSVSEAAATDVAIYNAATLATRSAPSQQFIMDKAPFYVVHDDHEYGMNDLRWLMSQFDATHPTFTVNTETQMHDIMDAGAASTEHYSIGNAVNNDAGIDDGAFYHRFNLGNHAEVFVISAVCWGYDPTHPTRLVRPDYGAANLMLGAKQNQWLRDRLKASTKKFKIIMSPKMTHTAEFTNPDGWISYFDELDDGAGNGLLPFVDDATDWAVPGGVIWCTGDYHTPSVHASWKGVDGATYDHVEVCACPADKDGQGVRDSGVGGKYTVKWVNTGQGNALAANESTADDTHRYLRNFGVIEVAADGSYMEAKIVLTNGSVWWKGKVYAGENKLTYDANSIGIS